MSDVEERLAKLEHEVRRLEAEVMILLQRVNRTDIKLLSMEEDLEGCLDMIDRVSKKNRR
ncbi:MAG: hypothetical protein QXR05_07155 [Candidatus Methanomethylicia archaeon]